MALARFETTADNTVPPPPAIVYPMYLPIIVR
jgi:hypothetical protein